MQPQKLFTLSVLIRIQVFLIRSNSAFEVSNKKTKDEDFPAASRNSAMNFRIKILQ